MVFISKKQSTMFNEHASACLPNECIGIFECEESSGNYLITDIYPMKNVAVNKRMGAQIPKKSFRKFSRRIASLKRKNRFLGVYHSHPSGKLLLSEQDMYSAMLFKMFKIQLVIGIRNGKIKKTFWKKNEDGWQRISIGRQTRSLKMLL